MSETSATNKSLDELRTLYPELERYSEELNRRNLNPAPLSNLTRLSIADREFQLPLQTELQLVDFIHLAFGIRLPNQQICANHSTPFRAFADAYFAKSPLVVWKASRGLGGKTFLLSLLSLVEA